MHNVQMKYRFMQQDNAPTKVYIYDDVTAIGDFNWETWQYDESETSANHFVKLLSEIPDGGDIELHVNSYGGDVKEGVAIYNLLKQKNCNKVCYIDCFAYSVAYVIAMACDKIIMGLGTTIMIHDMWTYTSGNAKELRKQADDLDVLMESNRQIFLARCNLTEEELISMMEKETIIGPDKCLEYGFCDEIDNQECVTQSTLSQLSERRFNQMKSSFEQQQSLMEFAKQFVKNVKETNADGVEGDPKNNKNPEEQIPKEQTLEEHENKALHMMGAFFNALSSVKIKN